MKISETSFLNYLKVTCCSFKFQYLFPIIFSIIMEDLFDGACSFNRSVVCVYLLVCLWLIERGIYMVWPTVKELPITRKKTPLNRVESYLLYKRTELLIVSLPFLISENMVLLATSKYGKFLVEKLLEYGWVDEWKSVDWSKWIS